MNRTANSASAKPPHPFRPIGLSILLAVSNMIVGVKISIYFACPARAHPQVWRLVALGA
jgi:hypothetical protein